LPVCLFVYLHIHPFICPSIFFFSLSLICSTMVSTENDSQLLYKLCNKTELNHKGLVTLKSEDCRKCFFSETCRTLLCGYDVIAQALQSELNCRLWHGSCTILHPRVGTVPTQVPLTGRILRCLLDSVLQCHVLHSSHSAVVEPSSFPPFEGLWGAVP
jgi:hypothetical protein